MPGPEPAGGNEHPSAATTDRHLTRVARGGAIGLLGAVVSAAAGFVLVLVVTRLFPPQIAGVFFSATSVFLILLALATLGTDAGLGRFMLRYEKQGQREDVPLVIRAALRPVVAASVLIAVVLLIWAEPVARLLGLTGDGTAVLRALAIVLPAAALNDFFLSGTRAFGRMRTTAFVDKMFRAGTQPFLAALAYVVSGSLLALTVSWVIPYALAAVVSFLLFRRFARARGSLRPGAPSRSYSSVRRQFWGFTWPRAITRLAQIGIQRADIVIIAALLSPKDAAIYTAATRFVALGQFGTQAISQVLQPRFTALLATGELAALREVYKTSTAWSMALSWPIYIIVGCAPTIYLALFGDGYGGAGVIVVVGLMAAAMMVAVFSGPVDTLLLMSGRSSTSLVNALVALTVDIVLCFVLVPVWGIPGAALAWALAVSTRSMLAFFQVRHQLAITPVGIQVALSGAASLVAFAVPLLVLDALGAMEVLTFVVALGIGAMVYAAILWAVRRPLKLDVILGAARRQRPGARTGDSAGPRSAR